MKKLLLVLTLFTGFNSYSQGTTNQFSLNFLIPSAEYEVSVSQHATVDAILGLGFGYHDSAWLEEAEFGFFPQLMGQYRYYYNLGKRERKGKKISENSGNYVAAVGIFSVGDPIFGDMELNNDYSGFVGPSWGLQRVYNSNFKLNLNLGAGYGFNDSGDSGASVLIGLQLGFKLGKT